MERFKLKICNNNNKFKNNNRQTTFLEKSFENVILFYTLKWMKIT